MQIKEGYPNCANAFTIKRYDKAVNVLTNFTKPALPFIVDAYPSRCSGYNTHKRDVLQSFKSKEQ